ncbi:phage virion morphogenesis protein [Novosphingobium sp. 9]|uniref:phage virion morphogenesis protein n=1 Tax=Novosphingobium sp. 9 TaxID=2025349 RepID=UPI0021B68477|nr:phage virion morphogenesis protein [Novosphingobium sp. 9]
MADDFDAFGAWFGRILQGLDPAHRRRAALKLGQALRRSNLKRVADNVQPDGSPMEPRKPRLDRRGRLARRHTGKMFKGLRRLKNWKIDADETGVEIRPANGSVDRVAAVSQYGEMALVGRLRNGSPIRYRYPVREILGFSTEDERLAMEIAEAMINPDA